MMSTHKWLLIAAIAATLWYHTKKRKQNQEGTA